MPAQPAQPAQPALISIYNHETESYPLEKLLELYGYEISLRYDGFIHVNKPGVAASMLIGEFNWDVAKWSEQLRWNDARIARLNKA